MVETGQLSPEGLTEEVCLHPGTLHQDLLIMEHLEEQHTQSASLLKFLIKQLCVLMTYVETDSEIHHMVQQKSPKAPYQPDQRVCGDYGDSDVNVVAKKLQISNAHLQPGSPQDPHSLI